MRVSIDEPGCDDEPRSVEVLPGGAYVPDGNDLATGDSDIGQARRSTGPIDNQTISNSDFDHVLRVAKFASIA